MTVRTRFAPSPTGYLHVGGARTALFCYLFTRRMGGDFVLRIEDTDQQRSTRQSVDAILDAMKWLGLEHDEGPFYQSHRMDRYREVVDQLVARGDAYRCYCSPEELESMRAQQLAEGLKPRYDGRHRDFEGSPPEGVEPVIRFKNPTSGSVAWDDAVKGPIEVQNEELDDLVIARSDGTPTYNLTVVVDDVDMAITHVIRGDDHVNNTPRQVNIYRAMGASIPVFAHLPMILGDDGARLSKRHGAVSVMQYHDNGYLPEALLNYLVRLGWSHGDQEIFTRDEMIELFSLEDVNRAPSSFNTEKLNWINHYYMQNSQPSRIAEQLEWHLAKMGYDVARGPDPTAVVELFKERAQTLEEMAAQASFLYEEFEAYEEKAAAKQLKPAAVAPLLRLKVALSAWTDWTPAALQGVIQSVVDDLGVGFGKVGQPLRVALTGRSWSPGNDQVLAALGRERSLMRIERALHYIDQHRDS